MPNHVIRDRIWDSGKLERCSDGAASWYPWIFLVCNEHGIFEYHPRSIWMTVFRRRPSVSQADVSAWLAEYEREGLLIRFHLDGGLAFWTGFKGRKPSERRENTYPDPLAFPEVVARLQALGITEFDGRALPATKGRKSRDKGAEEPRQNRASSDLDQEQERELEQDHSAAGAAPPPDQPVKAWSTEACDEWKFFLGTPPGARIGAALKPLVEEHTWEVVRPLWRDYLEEAQLSREDPKWTKPETFAQTFKARLARSRAETVGPAGSLVRVGTRGLPPPTAKDVRRQASMVAGVVGGLKGDGTYGGGR